MIYRILAASYSNNVTTLTFDDEKQTLHATESLTIGHHPSWLTSDPKYPSMVWTGLEQADGKIVALKFDQQGKGTIVGETTAGGKDPCHLVVVKGELVFANYSSGIVGSLPLSVDSCQLPVTPDILKLGGSGPDKSRQEASHPHQVYDLAERDELLIPDLGGDAVYRLKKMQTGDWSIVGHIGFEAGGGPRHVVYHNGDLYTLLELSSKVVRHRFPPPPEKPKFVASKPTMSNPPPQPNNMLAAEILLPPPNASFPAPYLYLSNRNDPSPEGDIISIFSVENSEGLELVDEIRTGLSHVRGIVFGGPDDKYLIAGGANSGGVKLFERINGGKALKEIAFERSIEAPTGFLWL
ncbi:Lactonase, 7-bladed beta-propeller-domain-containing protein [Crepidotus variabilis]|uniref:Lactonase, 7-bladed beta-propeller-domain-containing protein n=1 Tax=Crepidotus variabilis TaxID=179855 RepID=A0A9P6JLR2_9AGAR|nr:Lactonase, 7-bladed beta-propeller-domain-containing protein [Crepidotus variabilis]